MKWYRNNWYYVGGGVFVALSFYMGLFRSDIDPVRKILVFSFMALMIHQFEEYVLPGGFPMCWNMGVVGERKSPERYILNKKSAFICNVVCMYPLYIAAIIWSDFYLLGLVTVYFHLTQIIMHGIIINKKMRSFYNPGMASIIFILIPLGVYYIWYIAAHCVVPVHFWWLAFVLLPVVAILALLAPMNILKDKNSPYPWTEEEARRFHVREKVEKLEANFQNQSKEKTAEPR